MYLSYLQLLLDSTNNLRKNHVQRFYVYLVEESRLNLKLVKEFASYIPKKRFCWSIKKFSYLDLKIILLNYQNYYLR